MMTIKVSQEMAAKLAREAEDLEGTEVPAGVSPTRRGSPRSRVYSIRMNDNEIADLERIAGQRDLPASTVARTYILAGIRKAIADQGTPHAIRPATSGEQEGLPTNTAAHELAKHLREAAGILDKMTAA